jgi:hypothetical protein
MKNAARNLRGDPNDAPHGDGAQCSDDRLRVTWDRPYRRWLSAPYRRKRVRLLAFVS